MFKWQPTQAGWLSSGRMEYRETVVDGLGAAPQAFVDLLAGRTTGKTLVRVADA